MNPRKEERQDEMSGKPEFQSNVPKPGEEGSERFNYRVVTVDKDTEHEGRYDKHKGKGYVDVQVVGRQHLMACPKPQHLARVKAAGQKSADRIVEPVKEARRRAGVRKDGASDIQTIDYGKGPLHDN